jgi:hypothetical protein
MSIKITCITKSAGNHENPYIAISKIGWVDESNSNNKGINTREEMFEWVAKGGEAFVYNKSGTFKSKLITATSSRGTRYVKTIPDSTENDNLLKMDEC